MGSRIEDQDFWKMISYTAQQQAKELIRLKTRLFTLLKVCLIAFAMAAIYLIPYFLGKVKLTLNYMSPIFVFLLTFYVFTIYISHLKKEFDSVKKQSIDYIKNEGCSCMDKYCEHKDQYVKYMNDRYHINLSFV